MIGIAAAIGTMTVEEVAVMTIDAVETGTEMIVVAVTETIAEDEVDTMTVVADTVVTMIAVVGTGTETIVVVDTTAARDLVLALVCTLAVLDPTCQHLRLKICSADMDHCVAPT